MLDDEGSLLVLKACCDANTLASHPKHNLWSAFLIYSLLYTLQSSKWSNRKSACSDFFPPILNILCWISDNYFNHTCPENRPCCAFHSTCKILNLHTNKINNAILIAVLFEFGLEVLVFFSLSFQTLAVLIQVLALCVDMSQGHAIIGLTMAFVRWWLGSLKSMRTTWEEVSTIHFIHTL